MARSHNVKYHPTFKEITDDLKYEIYEELDRVWDWTGFTPNPIPVLAQKFSLTSTHILIVILAWRESRLKESIYGPKLNIA